MSAIAPKVGFVSLGCPKNLVDSEVMMGILARHGYALTPRAAEAEILVVNTCSFIGPAQQESVDTILEMAEYKKFGAAQKLIVAGCLVERYREQILEQIPEVDAVVGTGEVERILEAVQGSLRVLPAEPPAFLYHDLTPRVLSTLRHSAYIKIAEGCDHPCSFCIIPQLRGKFRSRRFESVVREAQQLARAGVREVTLIGQDTTSYGEDLSLRDGLALLLDRLAQIEDLFWVRFLYCYPNRVTQKLLDTIAAHPRLVKYMDMPLQHASRKVLTRMKRGSSGDAFLKLLERIRGTDNASSFALGQKVDAETIAVRRERLMAIQKRISRQKLRQRVGKRVSALVEGPSKENELVWEARLEGMAPEIDGRLFLTDIETQSGETARPGDLARVEITKADAYDLIGRVIEILQRRPSVSADPANVSSATSAAAPAFPAAPVQRISTGAPLRILS